MLVFPLVTVSRLPDVDADLAWTLGLIVVAVVAVVIGWLVLLHPPTR